VARPRSSGERRAARDGAIAGLEREHLVRAEVGAESKAMLSNRVVTVSVRGVLSDLDRAGVAAVAGEGVRTAWLDRAVRRRGENMDVTRDVARAEEASLAFIVSTV
jgi:hypothetical protein